MRSLKSWMGPAMLGGALVATPLVGLLSVSQGTGAAGYTCHGHSPSKRYRMAGVGSPSGVLFPCA